MRPRSGRCASRVRLVVCYFLSSPFAVASIIGLEVGGVDAWWKVDVGIAAWTGVGTLMLGLVVALMGVVVLVLVLRVVVVDWLLSVLSWVGVGWWW